jgi:hypothetical protein
MTKAQEMWAAFEKAMLFDFAMTSRERHLAAACYWFGMSCGLEAVATCRPTDLEAISANARRDGINALACITHRPPDNDKEG